ncbi:MAG: tetratricopeptide repeat protein, partial [candidate division WOR-3 bacterium]
NHFTIANDSQKALLYSKQAALKAKENYAHTLAIKFFDNALKYEDNPDEIFKIRFALAETFSLAGDYKKAIQELNRCCKIDPHAYRVYDKFGKVYENVGNFKKSLKYYMLGLQETQEMEVAYAFKIAVAWVYTRLGQYFRAQKECEKILKKKERLKKRYIGETYIVLGSVFLNLGKFDKAESCYREGLKLIRVVGDKNLIATCYLNLALTNQRKSNIEVAIKFYERALNLYEEIGYQNRIVSTLVDLGTLYTDYNQPKAEEYLKRALSIAQLIGAERERVYLYSSLGTVSYNQLKNDKALFNFKKALAYAEKNNFTVGVILSNLDLSGFYREQGTVRRGKKCLKSARYIAEKMNLKYYLFWCILEEIEYLLRSKSYKKANRLSEKLLSQLRSEQNTIYKIYGLLYRARTVMALRSYAKAHVYYKQAYDLITSQSLHGVAGEVYYYWGITYRDEKKFKEARKMFVEAQKIFEDIGNVRYVEKLKKELAKLS